MNPRPRAAFVLVAITYTSVAFGFWQRSVAAGFWMFGLLSTLVALIVDSQ